MVLIGIDVGGTFTDLTAVEAGGTPPGMEPTYDTLRPAEAVVSRDADWRALLAPEAPRPEILQQVSPPC